MSASMTALQKPDGGVRGTATGTSFRRLVARTLARQFGKAVEATCAPSNLHCQREPAQIASDTQSGQSQTRTPCARCCPSMALVLTTMCTEAPCWQSWTRFQVCKGCCFQSHELRLGRCGVQHRIIQAEGGEQGDPLMPLLFSLAIHDSLQQAQREFRADENLFAFLDDVYFTSPTPNRTRTAYDCLGAGIQIHTGKTRVWNRASVCPEGMVELGPEVWNPEGVKVLGTPVGSTRFVEELVNKRLEEEAQLWEAIPTVPDLQAAWQILLQCAGPRCHHMLWTLPPSQSPEYAQAHDAGMLRVMDTLLALSGDPQEVELAHNIASLPMRLVGLGLRRAQRMAPAAYWASWAATVARFENGDPSWSNLWC